MSFATDSSAYQLPTESLPSKIVERGARAGVSAGVDDRPASSLRTDPSLLRLFEHDCVGAKAEQDFELNARVGLDGVARLATQVDLCSVG